MFLAHFILENKDCAIVLERTIRGEFRRCCDGD